MFHKYKFLGKGAVFDEVIVISLVVHDHGNVVLGKVAVVNVHLVLDLRSLTICSFSFLLVGV